MSDFYFCFYLPGGVLFSMWRCHCIIVLCGWFELVGERTQDLITVNERPMNCEFTGQFWTVCAYKGLGDFGRSAQ